MNKSVRSISSLALALIPLLFFVLILPISLTFDSLNYWMTRPTCLNCGSLTDYLRTSSLSIGLAAGALGGLARQISLPQRLKEIIKLQNTQKHGQ